MKVEFIEEKIDRNVTISIKESEIIEIRKFIGGTSDSDRKKYCSNDFNDNVIYDLYLQINELLGDD